MLYQFDLDAFRAIHLGLHQSWLDPFFAFFSYLGLGAGLTIAIFLGLLAPLGRRVFWPLISALIAGGLLFSNELKRLIPRERPSNLPWAHPQEPIFQGSFPSGHTTASFSVAVCLFLYARKTKQAWVGWAGLLVASLIGLSRIYRGVHWPSDVLGGALCGTIFGCLSYLVFTHFDARKAPSA